MKSISTIGVDLAKNSFQLHGVDKKGKTVLRRTLKRDKVALFFANLPACLVGMEACAGSAYWARVIESCGHTVRRIHPRFVTPFLMADKNDANDAEAICEAVQRPRMRFVPHKTQDQSDIQALHRARSGFVQARTATINRIRGLLGEHGIVIRQGARYVRKQLPMIIGDLDNGLSEIMRGLLAVLHEHIAHLDTQIAKQETTLKEIAQTRDDCQRLQKIPGVGVLTATILVAVAGRAVDFKNGREFAAFLGLVPRQHSTGGRPRLLGITKRGDRYARTLLIHGARSVIRAANRRQSAQLGWLAELVLRRGMNRAGVALANKMARTAWCMLANGTEYKKAA